MFECVHSSLCFALILFNLYFWLVQKKFTKHFLHTILSTVCEAAVQPTATAMAAVVFSIWMEWNWKIKCKLLWNLCKVFIFPHSFAAFVQNLQQLFGQHFVFVVECHFGETCGFLMCALNCNCTVHNTKWRWVYYSCMWCTNDSNYHHTFSFITWLSLARRHFGVLLHIECEYI